MARRDSLSELKGPPARSTTHPAAGPRLQIAKALLATAAAEAEAAAKAAAAEALQQADATAAAYAALSSLLKSGGKAADAAVASGAGASDKQQTQHELHPADSNDKRLRHLAAGPPVDSSGHEDTWSADSNSTVPRSAPTVSDPIIARGVESAHSPGTRSQAAVDQEQLQQLTQLMRAQPYKPLQTKPAQLESTLLHFVHRGPLRLYVKGQEW